MIRHADPKVQEAGEIIASHLTEIERLFKPGVKLTFLARWPDTPDGGQDIVITSDDLGGAIKALEIRKANPDESSELA